MIVKTHIVSQARIKFNHIKSDNLKSLIAFLFFLKKIDCTLDFHFENVNLIMDTHFF